MVYFFGGGETLLPFPFYFLPSVLFSSSTMDAILDDWKKLSLTDVEGAKVSLRKSKNRNVKEYVLAAKFLTKRALNVEVIGSTFKPFGGHEMISRFEKLMITYSYLYLILRMMLKGF